MAKVELRGTMRLPEMLTDHGKRAIALSMIARGQDFQNAADALRGRSGSGYVWRYLVCQAVELIVKGCLQLRDFDTYSTRKLRSFHHRLLILADHCSDVYGVPRPRGEFREELRYITSFYERHELRYASGLDIFVDPNTIPCDRLSRRLRALVRLVLRHRNSWELPD